MSKNNQSLWKRTLLPERVNRLQFLIFFIVANAASYLLTIAMTPFWLVFYSVSVFFYLRYARARVNDWDGDTKHWINMLAVCFLLIIIGVFNDAKSAMLLFAAILSLATVFVSNLVLLLKPGTGPKAKPLINWAYYKEAWGLKIKKRAYARQEELKKLRTEVDELEKKISKKNP